MDIPAACHERQESTTLATVKEMEVLLLPATEGFLKIPDLNLMDKQL